MNNITDVNANAIESLTYARRLNMKSLLLPAPALHKVFRLRKSGGEPAFPTSRLLNLLDCSHVESLSR